MIRALASTALSTSSSYPPLSSESSGLAPRAAARLEKGGRLAVTFRVLAETAHRRGGRVAAAVTTTALPWRRHRVHGRPFRLSTAPPRSGKSGLPRTHLGDRP